VALDVHFGEGSSDVVQNVVVDETHVKLDVDSGVVAGVEFNVSGKHHATKIVCIGRRNGSVIVLEDDRREFLGNGGESGGGADFDTGDARS